MLIIIALIVVSLVHPVNFYAKSGHITEVCYINDTVTFEDSAGNRWEFKGTEDWDCDDWVAVIMCDNGTPDIHDDRIVNVRYEMWN